MVFFTKFQRFHIPFHTFFLIFFICFFLLCNDFASHVPIFANRKTTTINLHSQRLYSMFTDFITKIEIEKGIIHLIIDDPDSWPKLVPTNSNPPL